MENCTFTNGMNNNAMIKTCLKRGKGLAFVAFFLFFALGAIAQPITNSRAVAPPQMQVRAQYYPDASYPNSAYVKVYWGTDFNDSFFDFESGTLPSYWNNDSNYPWVVVSPDTLSFPGYNGNYCMKSGNGGVENSTSSIEATLEFGENGSISFIGGCYGEGYYYDVCEFYIDGIQQFSYGNLQTWNTYTYDVTAGVHTFKWSYTKDFSENSEGDAFFVDDVTFTSNIGPRSDRSAYNIYRMSCDGGNSTLIASNVTGNQFIDQSWADLEEGAYQFGVEVAGATTSGRTWSNCLTKSPVDYFDITASSSPEAGGTVSGGGTFTYGQTCTLRARANAGYYFSYWTTLNDTVPFGYYETDYSFTVTESANYIANFEPMGYDMYLTVEPYEAGTAEMINNDDYYVYCGDTVTISASTNPGYTFLNWTANGTYWRNTVELSTDSIYTFVIDTAFLNEVFEGVDPGEFPEGRDRSRDFGAVIEITANFIEGTDGCLRPNEFAIIGVEPDQATFSWTENGTSESWYVFLHDMTPTPAPTEDLIFEVTENPCTVTNLQPGTVYRAAVIPSCGVVNNVPNTHIMSAFVEFTTLEACPTPRHVGVDNVTDATATASWADYSESYLVQLGHPTILFNEDFDNGIPENWNNSSDYPWTVVDGHIQSGNHHISNSESGISVTMNYPADGTIAFDAFCRGEGTSSGGNYIDRRGYYYDHCDFFIDSTLVFITADSIIGWNRYSFDVTAGEHTFTWLYIKDSSMDPIGDYFAIDNVLMITEINWDNPVPAEDAEYTFTGLAPTTDYCLRVQGDCGETMTEWCLPVVFTTTESTIVSHTIIAAANPSDGGTITGAGTYDHGSTCTLVASANEGYTFLNWTKDGEIVGTTVSFSFTVTEDATYVANFSLNSYEITAAANPSAGGSVTGAGTYNYFETCTLTASENEGYTFLNWTKDGEIVGNTLSISFTVTEAATYVANFSLNSYEITASANPSAGGTVTGAGTYNHFETCTLTASENEGYTFLNWTKDGEIVGSTLSISFTVTEAADYVANFSLNSYEITASANPSAGGTVTGAGTYNHFETCTLTASENEGYTFLNWTKDGEIVGTTVSFSFTVTEDAAYVANFSLNSYEITAAANPSAGGNVTGAGTYNHFETCTLTASENEGYTFLNWTKDGEVVGSTLSISFTVTEAADYVANFSLNGYEITASANPSAGGNVTGAGTYNHFETCTLTASENEGYTFLNWTKDGEIVGSTLSISFTVTEDAAYVANFSLNSYEITASANPSAGGSVTGAGTYNHFETCTLTASENEGYTFLNWTKDGEIVGSTLSISFTVTEDAAYVANFSLNSYEITASANPSAGGSVTGAGTYNHFETCTLTASENEGYTFLNWTKDGEIVGSTLSISFTVTEAASYVANFSLNSYEITASANPSAGGSVTGAGTYNHFETCTLTASENEGYTFLNWTKDGEIVGTTVSFSFTVTEDATYVANFSLNSYEITASANPSAGGNVTGAGTYNHFETCTLTASENEGYTFLNWTKDGEIVGSTLSISFTVTEDATYIANFSLNSYEITASANPSAGGNVTGAGTYNHFETCTLTASENEGYTFLNWTKDGEIVGTTLSFSFTVTEAASYVANFQLNSYEITATASPSAGGTITGAGTYNHFQTCTLTATPNPTYLFVNWTKNGEIITTDASYSFTVTEGATYVAHFERVSYEITATANPTEGGTVSGDGTYSHGSRCTLSAVANEGYTFINWTKDGQVVSTNPSYSFIVTGAGSYVANFNLNMYIITTSADPTEGGSVNGGGAYLYGNNCTVNAVANPGYSFVNWTNNGTSVSSDATYTFTVTENATLVAHFALDHYDITVSVDPADGGTATGGGSFIYGETCTLVASANEGYTFVNWTKNGTVVSSNASYSFTVTDNGSYVANFAVSRYTITVVADPTEGGSVHGGGTFDYGHVTTLRAIVNNGYEFVNWTKDGSVVSTSTTYAIVVREDATYVAHFRANVFEIKAKTDPEYMGDIEGIGLYNYGETCTLTVTPHDEYEFVNWTLYGEVVSENESFSFTVTEPREYVAHLQHVEGVGEQNGIMVSLFPNPAKSKLTIEASEPINTLEIYTINGALVSKQSNCSDKIMINVENFASGTYMIRLTTDSAVEIRRFVKE